MPDLVRARGTERAVLASLFAGSCGDKVVTIPARAI
jgi:hypothetical protein